MKRIEMSEKELKVIRKIRNAIVHKEKTPTIRELMEFLGYNSTRSAALIINKLIEKGVLKKKEGRSYQIKKSIREDKSYAQTIYVPLVGSAACGAPVLAEENIEAMIPVSTKLAKSPYKYFLLRVTGSSMTKKNINDGDLVLVRQQQTANNGNIVVALINDEATIKEFHRSGDVIILKPYSTNDNYKSIILTKDFQIQGVVVTTIREL